MQGNDYEVRVVVMSRKESIDFEIDTQRASLSTGSILFLDLDGDNNGCSCYNYSLTKQHVLALFLLYFIFITFKMNKNVLSFKINGNTYMNISVVSLFSPRNP